MRVIALQRCVFGVVGPVLAEEGSAEKSKTDCLAELAWKGRPKKVIVLYAKSDRLLRTGTQVLRGTGNPVGIWGDHPPRLNTTRRPIVHKYREGKVKSTPDGE